jgi:hypothetical protein
MDTDTLRALSTTAVVLLALAGCGGGAEATPTPTPIFGTSISSPANSSTPTGQHGAGTIMSTSVRHYFDGGANYTCSDAWTATLSFIVGGQNTVTGSGTFNRIAAVVCTLTYGLPPQVQTIQFSVSGEKTTAGFTLQFTVIRFSPPPPAGDFAGIESLLHASTCPDQPGPKLSIAFDRPNHANASPVLNAKLTQSCPGPPQGSQNDIFSSTSTIGSQRPVGGHILGSAFAASFFSATRTSWTLVVFNAKHRQGAAHPTDSRPSDNRHGWVMRTEVMPVPACDPGGWPAGDLPQSPTA